MKRKMTAYSTLFLLAIACVLSASTLQEKGNKNGKGQQQNDAKAQNKNGKPSNIKAHNSTGNSANGRSQKDDQPGKNLGQGKDKNSQGKPDKDDKAAMNGKPLKEIRKNENRYANEYKMLGYNWSRDNFQDRKSFRKQDKVTICHKFGNGSESPVSIRVSANATKAHLSHGDVMGDCPVVNDNRYSDRYWRNRSDYYNNLQYNQEQVLYSSSILDYALQRLAGSRSQLAIMQSNNMPLADIQRKQQVVNGLEENVSVLEQLIGLAANVVVNKLM